MTVSGRAKVPVFAPARRLARLSKWSVRTVAAGLVVTVAACSQTDGDRASTGVYRLLNSERNPHVETLENTVEYTLVPPTRAVVSVPDALVVFERNLGGALEQRIVLPNATAVRGDNVLHIRAQTADSARIEAFRFDEVTTRFGGLPPPFERLTDSALTSGSDALGSYVYARENVGTNTVCVLVMRRMGVGARPLPRGTHAIDLVMRNCVAGTLAEALAPMSERALAVGGGVRGANAPLSPYAAPQG